MSPLPGSVTTSPTEFAIATSNYSLQFLLKTNLDFVETVFKRAACYAPRRRVAKKNPAVPGNGSD
jgi:hypothetical protein